ncbi:MAG: hypothetical protein JWM11_6458 [Planctomycetaceae bacterium]|nr:hypothetical protein [Planctomycetaceae bacterium]
MPYHLVVSSDSNAFAGNQFEMPVARCLESTDPSLRDYFFRFGESRIDELLAFPALLAHERGPDDPQVQLVRLTEIIKRRDRVRARFEPLSIQPLPFDKYCELAFELDIEDFEYHRTHWAIKSAEGKGGRNRCSVQEPLFCS